MAGRLLIQKLSSGVYRSTGRLGAHASASGRATAPVTRTAPAASYFSIVQCSHAEAKTNWPVKRTLSSSSFNKHEISSEAEMPLRRISVSEHAAVLNKSSNTMMGLDVFIGLAWIYIASNMDPDGSASCCNCIAMVQNLRCNEIRSCKYYGAAVVCFIYQNSSTLACERESNLLYS